MWSCQCIVFPTKQRTVLGPSTQLPLIEGDCQAFIWTELGACLHQNTGKWSRPVISPGLSLLKSRTPCMVARHPSNLASWGLCSSNASRVRTQNIQQTTMNLTTGGCSLTSCKEPCESQDTVHPSVQETLLDLWRCTLAHPASKGLHLIVTLLVHQGNKWPHPCLLLSHVS